MHSGESDLRKSIYYDFAFVFDTTSHDTRFCVSPVGSAKYRLKKKLFVFLLWLWFDFV